LRRRPDAVGQLDDLRGDRLQCRSHIWEQRRGRPATYEKKHGYVFEVFTDASHRQNPVPIRRSAASRTRPWSSSDLRRVYLTEDAEATPNGLFLTGGTAPHGVTHPAPAPGAKLSPTAGKLEAIEGAAGRRQRAAPDLAVHHSAQLGPAVPGPIGPRCPSATRRGNSESASSSPQASTSARARSWRAHWGYKQRHLSTSSRASAFAASDLPATPQARRAGLVHNYTEQTIQLVHLLPRT